MVSDVYATGRILTQMGIALGHDMTLEACFTKLSFLMSKFPGNQKKIIKLMSQNLKGELSNVRRDENKFSLKNSEFIKGLASYLQSDKPEEIHQIVKTIEPVIVNSAASVGDIKAFNYLKDTGINFGVVDYRGRNCLHIAAISRNFEIADFVLN